MMHAENPEEFLSNTNLSSVNASWRNMCAVFERLQRTKAYGGLTTTNLNAFRNIKMYIKEQQMTTRKSPAKKPTNTPQPPVRPSVTWVNLNLGDDDIPGVEELLARPDTLAAMFVEMGMTGDSITLKWVDTQNSACATFIQTCDLENPVVYGLSGWSDISLEAVASLVYKWYYKLEKKWPEDISRPQRRFR